MYTAQAYEEVMQLEIISYHIDKARGRKVFVFNKKKISRLYYFASIVAIFSMGE